MARFDLTNFEWSVIQPLLPKVPGVKRVDDRRVLNGILWLLAGHPRSPSRCRLVLEPVAQPAGGPWGSFREEAAGAWFGRARDGLAPWCQEAPADGGGL